MGIDGRGGGFEAEMARSAEIKKAAELKNAARSKESGALSASELAKRRDAMLGRQKESPKKPIEVPKEAPTKVSLVDRARSAAVADAFTANQDERAREQQRSRKGLRAESYVSTGNSLESDTMQELNKEALLHDLESDPKLRDSIKKQQGTRIERNNQEVTTDDVLEEDFDAAVVRTLSPTAEAAFQNKKSRLRPLQRENISVGDLSKDRDLMAARARAERLADDERLGRAAVEREQKDITEGKVRLSLMEVMTKRINDTLKMLGYGAEEGGKE